MDTNSQVCVLKKQLYQALAVRIWICSTINKSQEETLTIIERKNCGCTVGSMRVQLFLFIITKNKELNIFVPCPIEKKNRENKAEMCHILCWSFLLRRKAAFV